MLDKQDVGVRVSQIAWFNSFAWQVNSIIRYSTKRECKEF